MNFTEICYMASANGAKVIGEVLSFFVQNCGKYMSGGDFTALYKEFSAIIDQYPADTPIVDVVKKEKQKKEEG